MKLLVNEKYIKEIQFKLKTHLNWRMIIVMKKKKEHMDKVANDSTL